MVETDTTRTESSDGPAIERANAFDGDDDATVFQGEIHGETAEIAFRHLEGVVDEARVKFTSDGVYAAAVESSNIAMHRTFIPEEVWEKYTPTHGGIEGVDISELCKELRSLKTRMRDDDVLEFELGYGFDGEKVFEVTDSQGTCADIPVRRVTDVRMPPTVPDIDYAANVTITDGNVLREWVKGLPTAGVISVTASTDEKDRQSALTFEHKRDVSDSEDSEDAEYVLEDVLVVDAIESVEWGPNAGGRHHYDDLIAGEAVDVHDANSKRVRGTYSAEYLKLWAKRLRKTRTADVPYRLCFGEEWPMEVSREDGSPVVSEFLLAPRITPA